MKYKLAVFVSNIFLVLIETIFKIPIIGDIISRNASAKSEKTELHNSVLSSCITGDSFLNLYPELAPTHLKIDVDGIELKILHGLQNVLTSKKLRSIIVEAVHSGAEANSDEITKIISSYGFKRNEAKENPIKTNNEIFNIVFERG